MLLKSLEMQGFKSFPDKTVLDFENGITAVVGPNGSGKSNISDAIRWVLGEQSTKALRCSKMEDVIFGGSPGRRALGFAQVTLNIDNSDRSLPFESDTVSIARRYYRSGESEYLINKAQVRLRDVNELFMDTGLGRDGYSLVGQGKIDSIVSAKSEERREIFDEAAGISKYRYRKEEAERRLQRAEDNLIRLRDIAGELESRIDPLREQSEKAQQFLTLSEEKKSLEIGLWLDTLSRSGAVIRENEEKVGIASAQYQELEAKIDSLDQSVNDGFAKMNELSAKAEEMRAEAAAKEEAAAKKDGEASLAQNDIRHHTENIERIEAELSASSEDTEAYDRQIAEKYTQIEDKLKVFNEKNSAYVEYTQQLDEIRAGRDSSSDEIERSAGELTALQASLSEAKLAQNAAEVSIGEIRARIENAKEQSERWSEREREAKELLLQYDEQIEEARAQITAAKNVISGREIRLGSREKRVQELTEQSEKARFEVESENRRARLLEDLEKNMEGFGYSVKTILQEASRGTLRGIRGPVSRLLRVPEQYSVAVEVALGAALQQIVAETEEDVKQAINYLKAKNAGRATFLPMSVIRANPLSETGLSDCAGFIGMASELCSCDSDYKQIKDYLLSRIAVAEDFDSAAAIARKYRYRFRIVTLDGQVINAGGSMTGGSLQKNAGLLSRASEIERIRRKAAQLLKKQQELEAQAKTASEELALETAELTGARAQLASAQEDEFKLTTEQHRIESEAALSRENIENIKNEIFLLNGRAEELAQEGAKAGEKANEIDCRIEAVSASIDRLSLDREALNARLSEMNEHLSELRYSALEAKKDADALELSAQELEARRKLGLERRETLEEEIRTLSALNDELLLEEENAKQEAQSLREEAAALRERAQEVYEERTGLDAAITKLRAEIREKTDDRERVSHELAILTERKNNLQKEYDTIISSLWEEYELTRREAEQIAQIPENPNAARRALSSVRNKIKALGNVNVSAIEEYKEVSERYAFLSDQIGDIETSKEELQRMIRSLMGQMKDLFVARFEAINQNFSQIFRELFGGGKANLSLTEPEDVLASGIGIFVQPPGKIVSNIELLSGGEKALIAICIYFAIMKVSPPPFCVLDEIEAALDEVNVGKFAAYLRRMNANTQFIVITHRRGTMEEADVLYGVTMQNEGLSSLLTLHPFSPEAEEAVED